jgi:hypothetical protein
MAYPFASRTSAVNWRRAPIQASAVGQLSGEIDNLTATCSTLACELSVTSPAAPAVAAVIVPAPFARAVTRPVSLTSSAARLLDAQRMAALGTGWPFASSAVAVSCTVWPSAAKPMFSGVTLTLATITGGGVGGGGCVGGRVGGGGSVGGCCAVGICGGLPGPDSPPQAEISTQSSTAVSVRPERRLRLNMDASPSAVL